MLLLIDPAVERIVPARLLASRHDCAVRVSANVDDALRASVEPAVAQDGADAPRPAAQIALADVIRAIDGPLAGVGGRAAAELTAGPGAWEQR